MLCILIKIWSSNFRLIQLYVLVNDISRRYG